MALASTRSDLISRLDPQAQMSINPSGTYQTNLGATRVTAKPAAVSPGVTHAAADVANPYAQSVYEMKLRENTALTASTGSTYASNNERRVAAGLPPEYPTTAPPPPGNDGGYTSPPAPPPTGPSGPAGAGGDGTGDLLGQFTDQEITAAISALEAQYGMTREQLLQDQSLIGSQYRLLMARLNRQRQLGAEAVTSDAVSRGIYNSGIHGAALLDTENQSMEQIRDAEAQQLAQEQGIQTQLSFLDQQKAAEAAGIQASLRREQGNYHMAAGVPMPSQWGGGAPALGGAPGAAGAFNPPGVTAGGAVGGMQPISQPNMGAGVAPGSIQGSTPGASTSQPNTSGPLQQQYTQALQTLMAQGIDPNSPEGQAAFGQILQQMQAAVGPGNIQVGMGSNMTPYSFYQTPGMEGSGMYYTNTIDKAQRTNAANLQRMQANPQDYSQEQLRTFGLV